MWVERAENQNMFDSRGLTLIEVLAVYIGEIGCDCGT